MDYNSKNKPELEELATERGVSAEGKKQEIIERLQAQDDIKQAAAEDEANETKDEAPKDDGVMRAADVKPSNEQAPKDEAPDEPEAESKDEMVLVKLTTRANKFHYGQYRFSKLHPFQPVPKTVADKLVDMPNFRKASKSEAEKYYS